MSAARDTVDFLLANDASRPERSFTLPAPRDVRRHYGINELMSCSRALEAVRRQGTPLDLENPLDRALESIGRALCWAPDTPSGREKLLAAIVDLEIAEDRVPPYLPKAKAIRLVVEELRFLAGSATTI